MINKNITNKRFVKSFQKNNCDKSQKLKIIPLGGQEEVGRNMTVFEYGESIVLVDMGNQFPEQDTPGIDYIIPNIDYLKGKEKNIQGVVLTHGHLDHIGATSILLKELGFPPVIGKDLTLALVKARLEDYEKGLSKRLKTIKIKSKNDKLKLGDFSLEFFDVEHSIMDSVGVALSTSVGTAVHMGDWSMGSQKNSTGYENLSKFQRPIILMAESLGAMKHEDGKTEEEMLNNLWGLIKEAKERVIIGTFSSQIQRISDILKFADKLGKKVAIDGFSMKKNIEIAKELGYIKIHKNTMVDIKSINKYPDNKMIIICTGAQGEPNAAFSRIVNREHRYITLKKKDTIVFSSSVIPGNGKAIQRLKDKFYRECDNVIHEGVMSVHVSGHNNIEAIQKLIKQVRPDYFLPVYAYHHFLKEAKKVAENIGFPSDNIFVLDNGHVINFAKKTKPYIEKEKVDTSYVMVDGSGVGDIGEVVLHDRQLLSGDGMFVIAININRKTQELVGDIQIASRGFIYVKDNFRLINDSKRIVKEVFLKKISKDHKTDLNKISKDVRKSVGAYLFQKTQKKPMVLPMFMRI